MPRKVRNPKIDSRSARSQLKVRREPYWTRISKGNFLGYRKGPGTWIGRHRDERGQQHYLSSIGSADDALEVADPKERDINILKKWDILTFDQAQVVVSEWFQNKSAGIEDIKELDPLTVKEAIDEYLDDYKTRSGKSLSPIEYNINAHILPKLGDIAVKELTRKQINTWRNQIVNTPARLRTREGDEQKYRDIGGDPDTLRKRRATSNKVIGTLKAALNFASQNHDEIESADAWMKVAPFKGADAPRIRYLNDDEALRLVNACAPSFRNIMRAALLTGCRYGELGRLTANSFNLKMANLHISESKTGKERYISLSDEGCLLFSQLVAGKSGDDLILIRADGDPWGRTHQRRPMLDACRNANISPAASFHILRHSYASRLATQGVPMAVIAAQLGNSTRICERHYAHLSPGYVADTVRAAFGSMGIVEPNRTVVPIHGR